MRNRWPRVARLPVLLILAVALLALGRGLTPGAVAAEAAVAARAPAATEPGGLFEVVGRPDAFSWQGWSDKDKRYLGQIYARLQAGEAMGPQLYAEWQELQQALLQAEQTGYVSDPDVPLRIFPAQSTGVLQSLGLAMYAREQMLAVLLRRELGASAAPNLSGSVPSLDRLYPEPNRGIGRGQGSLFPVDGQAAHAAQYPQPDAVLKVLKELKRSGIPDALFAGRIYIAPYAFSGLEDGGWVTEAPRGTAAVEMIIPSLSQRVPGHPYSTVLHLFGHYVMARSFGFSPEENAEGWARYLALRTREGPFDGGDNWEKNSRENWAEDFRIAFGGSQSGYPHRGVYGQPKARDLASFRDLALEAMRQRPQPLHFTEVHLSDGRAQAYAAGLTYTRSLVTAARGLTIAGTLAGHWDAQPQVEVLARKSDTEPWKLVASAVRAGRDGDFTTTLTLGAGVHQVLVEAWSGETVAGQPFSVTVIPRSMAGAAWQLPDFPDMHGHWAEGAVKHLMELGAIGGFPDGTFRPGDQVTRGQFLKVLMVALRSEGVIDAHFALPEMQLFEDIDDHWARPYVLEAYLQRFFSSSEYYPRFAADEPITRIEMARLVGAALESASFDPDGGATAERFTDAATIEPWQRQLVGLAAKHGVINGYPDGSFGPQRTATRAEAAIIVQRLLTRLKQLKQGG